LQNFFLAASFKITFETSGPKFTKKIIYLDSLQKNTDIQKQIRPNWSLDEGDIADLNML